MKKLVALTLVVCLALALCACGSDSSSDASASTEASAEASTETSTEASTETSTEASTEASTETSTESSSSGEPVDISLWTYPIGDWGDQTTVDGILAQFNEAYPDIHVTVEYLTYQDGDDKVNTAIEGHAAPDLVMEGPERLVANWGARGVMVNLNDIWSEGDAETDMYPTVVAACKNTAGDYYEYPLCMTAHCMGINRDAFEAADAMQYVDQETHTWTTENFLKAVKALHDAGHSDVAAIYCGGQGGDQGTRAIVNNMYGGTFTNPEHTEYTVDSPENIKALQELVAQNENGIHFDPAIVGGDEINLFVQGVLQMAFCWNSAQEVTNAEALTFDVFPMAFPTDSGDPALCGGIWGFGIFDNGDQAKIDAAKTFIKWACNEEPGTCTKASTYWSVRQSLDDLYSDDEMKTEYGQFMKYMGDYYQVVPGWAEARTEWWNMLQRIGAGGDVATEVATFNTNANAAAAAASAS